MYKEVEIGTGYYCKRGTPGQITTIETLSAQGAMVGLIEAALSGREEERKAQMRKERASRLLPLPCPTCSHVLGYDPEDQVFAGHDGGAISTCLACGELLSLEQFQQHYTQRIGRLQADLAHAEEALRQVLMLKRALERSEER